MSDKFGSDMLPVITDYSVEIDVYETQDLSMFPEGVNGTFRLLRINPDG